MVPVSLENLRCFVEAARASSFQRGARAVALTPAAFGQRIKQLEDQVGTPLFARTTRGVTLTPNGLALVPLAERCLDAATACASFARAPIEMPATQLGRTWASLSQSSSEGGSGASTELGAPGVAFATGSAAQLLGRLLSCAGSST